MAVRVLLFLFVSCLTSSSVFAMSCTYYCSRATSCEQAVYSLIKCGRGSLDRDKDGIPCESLCSRSSAKKYTRKYQSSSKSTTTKPKATTTAPKKASKQPTKKMITQAQLGLKALGYYTFKVDGLSGKGTRAAVNKFREQQGLTQNGVINDEFLGMLKTYLVLNNYLAEGADWLSLES